jgi:O-antigen ligase
VFEAIGLFSHHLTYGGFVMCVLLVSGCLFLWGATGRRRRAAYGLASLILSFSLVWSYARSAWAGLFGGILAIGLLRGRKILILSLAGIILVIGFLLLSQPSVRFQVFQLAEVFTQPVSTSARLQLWSTSLRMIQGHPLFGVGLGQVKRSLVDYGCDLEYTHVHNDFLNVATNAGLLGLAAFIWIWVTFLRMVVRCRPRQQIHGLWPVLRTAGFGLMVAFLVAGLFQCYYTDVENAMLLWFLLGLVTAVCRMEGMWGATTRGLVRKSSGEHVE